MMGEEAHEGRNGGKSGRQEGGALMSCLLR